MAAHGPRLWETLQEFSQDLVIWTSRPMLLDQIGNKKMASLFSKALDFALTKAKADEQELATPILSLCHGIFPD